MKRTRALETAALALGLVGILMVTPACLIGSSSKTTRTGVLVSPETLATVDSGDSQQSVIDAFGEPTSKRTLSDGGAVWQWAYSETTTESGSVLLLFSSSKENEERHTAHVEFDAAGLVRRTWREQFVEDGQPEDEQPTDEQPEDLPIR